jgi:methylase of polypeptide subunit release factors
MEHRTVENSTVYLLETIKSIKENNTSLTILDVGAGLGTISIGFAQAIPNGQVTAVDLNPDALTKARG